MNDSPRILVVDDMPSIHDDFRKILVPRSATPGLDDLEAALFGAAGPAEQTHFELESAYQGREALAMVTAARAAGRPFALAFIDMRMPPGWDGLETIGHLWRADPALQVVICSANSDYTRDEILDRLQARDDLALLPKPFDPREVKRLAGALTQAPRHG